MLQEISITEQDILHQVKIACQIPELVEGIITRKIIADAAAKAGIEVGSEELQQGANGLRLMNQLNSSRATWEWLEKYNLSLDDFEEIVYNNIISTKLAEHLFADQIEPYFFQHQLDYAGAVIYEVVLDDEDLAMELYYALSSDEMSFHEVAREYIEDTELARKGGYRGTVNRKDLKPEISAAVFAATPPEILKPIVTSQGVHLIAIEQIIQPQLNEVLRYQILSDLFSQWLKQQSESIQVNSNLSADKVLTS